MKTKDSIQRFLFEHAPIRGEMVHLNASFQEIIQQHDYSPLLQRILGEALALVSLLSSIIKFRGRITLQFQGKGQLKLLLAQSNHELHIRGLVQVDGVIDEETLYDEFKRGVLVIMMDPEDSTQRYQGIVSWQGRSLAESVQGYFEHSEQLPTRIWLAVNEQQAAGLLLQKMPANQKETDNAMFDEMHMQQWEHITTLASTIKSEELFTLENQVILHRLFVEEDIRLFDAMPIIFQCTCSVARGENAILLLSPEEIEEELRDHTAIVVTCEFCNREFSFDRVDVAKILRRGGVPPTSTHIH